MPGFVTTRWAFRCAGNSSGRSGSSTRPRASVGKTIGSTVAARGLGDVIIAGLQTSNTAFVLQGGVIVGLLAVLVSDAIGAIARVASARRA